MDTIKWTVNNLPHTEDAQLKVMALAEVEKASNFHKSFPQYTVTPLADLQHMAS